MTIKNCPACDLAAMSEPQLRTILFLEQALFGYYFIRFAVASTATSFLVMLKFFCRKHQVSR